MKTTEQTNDLTILDQFAIAALPAVIAAATQAKCQGGKPHELDADAILYGEKPSKCAYAYADVAYMIAHTMLVVRAEKIKAMKATKAANQEGGMRF
jgi:hypothetical protein